MSAGGRPVDKDGLELGGKTLIELADPDSKYE